MRLYKRANRIGPPSWVIDYSANGERRRKVLRGVKTKRLAEAAFGEFRMKAERGQIGAATDEKMSLRDCLGAYLEVKRADVVLMHAKNLECYEAIILAHFGPDTPVLSLTAKDAAGFKTAMRERGNTPSTINRRLVFLRGAIRKAIADKKISRDPLAGVENVSDPSAPVWRWLTHEEIARLLDVCKHGARIQVNRGNGRNYETKVDGPRGLYPFIVFLLNSGARRGEAHSLRWRDLDMSRGLVRLVCTKRAARGRKAQERFIPMNQTLKELFEGMKRGAADDRVFSISLNNLRHKFERACKMAEVGHVRPHDLRHTFCSHLVMAGVPLNTVRELAGHESIAMTQRYSHLAPNVKASAVDTLNFGGAKAVAKVISLGERAG